MANDVGRAYCRNLRLRRGEPFGLIRLEAQQRWGPKAYVTRHGRVAAVSGSLVAVALRGAGLTGYSAAGRRAGMELGRRVKHGELRHSEAERLHLFLSLERVGVAVDCYPRVVYAARRREAAKLGYGAGDGSGALEVELGDLLQTYRDAVRLGLAAPAAPQARGRPSRSAVSAGLMTTHVVLGVTVM